MELRVVKNGDYPDARVIMDNVSFDAVIGKNGVAEINEKKEGDGKTPIGTFKILGVYFRSDRVELPKFSLPVHEIAIDDVWVDDPKHSLYNQPSKISELEKSTSFENLWREDHLYDIILDIDYNRKPAFPGKGSAIFIHVARNEKEPSLTPTAGCIALGRSDLLGILEKIDRQTVVSISS